MSSVTIIPSSIVHIKALPVDTDYIPEELKVVAETELFEDELTREDCLRDLRLLLSEVKDLHWQDEDQFLLAFLRTRKFDVNRAFDRVKSFYNCLGKRGHLYYRGFDYFRKIMKKNICYMLSHRDSDGSIICHFHFRSWEPKDISSEESVVLTTLGGIQALRSPATQIAGFQIIADFQDFGLKYLKQAKPSILLFMAELLQSTLPVRVRGIHVVNENFLFTSVFPVIKQLLSKKIRERIHFHGKDMKSLHKFFDPRILPGNLGGELSAYNSSDWQKRMESSADYIDHVLSFGYGKYLKKWRKEPEGFIIENNSN